MVHVHVGVPVERRSGAGVSQKRIRITTHPHDDRTAPC